MTLDEYLGIGNTVQLGTHEFQPGEIKAFAAKFDPQPFHLDEEAAKNSVFGALCASGWHTAAMWMKYNLAQITSAQAVWTGVGPAPEFGPSPGFKNLKWLKPVYAGEAISFTRTGIGYRPMASRPGWQVLTILAEAFDSTGAKVIEFENSVLVKTG
ncbi:dehydratase [Mesorhizobium sp. Root157]|uniref:MaoC family dehydratase n=1 Tax=Mesorhizobium sp. Root157 TaxID=1736477 RepID=UPI0006F636BA|nr:MaoC family dehydratase [Mesorhizobium sp. Root157]KQZ87085.1 dehydratase [Mesorhizobium sp. Root157]